MRTKTYILFFLMSIAASSMNAQSNDFGISGKLTTNANGDNDIVSKDLFTGSANIKIPFYNRMINGADLSICMNYSTKGIRVDDISSVVGLGWQLAYGGGIYRIIKGVADEYYEDFGGNVKGYWHLDKTAIDYAGKQYYENVVNKHIDGQPDVFKAVFGGKSIQFMISDDNTIVTIPENPNVKIERTINGSVITQFPKNQVANNLGFIITDENGNKFYYSIGDRMKSVHWSAGSLSVQYYTTLNWVLEKVITYNGQEIDYAYTESNEVKLSPHFNQSYAEYISGQGTTSVMDCAYGKIYDDDDASGSYYGYFKMLNLIQFPDVNVVFNYDGLLDFSTTRKDVFGLKALKSIQINDRYDQALAPQIYKFYQSYFTSNPSITSREIAYSQTAYVNGEEGDKSLRLKLNSISFGNGTQEQQYYAFSYNNSEALAERNSKNQDWFGYNTTTTSHYPNSSFVPGTSCCGWYGNIPMKYQDMHFPNFNNSGNNMGITRDPSSNINLRAAFTLSSFVNQNRGVVELKYALPQVEFTQTGILKDCDGLVLDKVIERDNFKSGGYLETDLEYEGGQYFIPSFNSGFDISDLFKMNVNIAYNIGSNYFYTALFNIISSQMLMSSDENIDHGFSKVTVKKFYKNDYANTSEFLGKQEHFFSNVKNVPSTFVIETGTSSGNTLLYNASNFILKRPTFNSISLLNHPGTAYYVDYEEPPFTSKQYFASWAVGIPWKTINYDNNNDVINSVENSYKVKIKAIDINAFLSLHACHSINCTYNYNNSAYYKDFYYPYSGYTLLTKVQNNTNLNGVSSLKEERITYDYRNNVSTVSTDNSMGEKVEKTNYYTYQFSNVGNANVNQLIADNVTSILFSETWKYDGANNKYLIDAKGSGIAPFINNKIKPSYTYKLATTIPISQNSIGNGPALFNINTASNGGSLLHFTILGQVEKYDINGNVAQENIKGRKSATLYDPASNNLLLTAANATSGEIGFTSFELAYTGNFTYSGLYVTSSSSKTGGKSLNLTSGQALQTNAQFLTGKSYVLSFWVKNGGSFQVFEQLPSGNNLLSSQSGPIINGWKYYWVNYTPSTANSNLKVTGACMIDEVRYYPANAIVNTYTYKPLVGVTSKDDPNNVITFYQYDSYGNLEYSKDQYGNILTKTKTAVYENE